MRPPPSIDTLLRRNQAGVMAFDDSHDAFWQWAVERYAKADCQPVTMPITRQAGKFTTGLQSFRRVLHITGALEADGRLPSGAWLYTPTMKNTPNIDHLSQRERAVYDIIASGNQLDPARRKFGAGLPFLVRILFNAGLIDGDIHAQDGWHNMRVIEPEYRITVATRKPARRKPIAPTVKPPKHLPQHAQVNAPKASGKPPSSRKVSAPLHPDDAQLLRALVGETSAGRRLQLCHHSPDAYNALVALAFIVRDGSVTGRGQVVCRMM